MAGKHLRSREPRVRRSRRLGAGSLSALEILVLGPLAAYLVLLVIPSAFDIESQCVGEFGAEQITGDTYFAGASVFGAFGWLAVVVGVIAAQIAESPRVAVLLPIAWFAVFVGGALVVAATIGPQLCPQ